MATSSWQGLTSWFSDLLTQVRNPDLIFPPAGLRRAGGDLAGYVKGGQLMVERCQRRASLSPNSHVLDVGCGDGRFASCLTRVLKKGQGTYTGFDVNAPFIGFLSNSIAKRYPNFSFFHADLWHTYYNPTGKYQAMEYRFPVADASVDLVFLNSIFTHFMPPEIAHYLHECSRVLKKGGVMLCTYFLANEESVGMDRAGLTEGSVRGQAPQVLNHRWEHCWTRSFSKKERVVVIDEDWLRAAHGQSGLDIEQVILGTWCGRKRMNQNTQQDIIVARRKCAA